MELFIGIILGIIALIIIGLILRKRVYDYVDRLEAWKLDIMGRNVAAQLGKIKNLNLSGETQTKFESWKERWDYIVSKELTNIEEHLLDAEDAADRFMVMKAKKTLKNTEEILQSIESRIADILQELDDLLESEKTSRIEVEAVEPVIKDLKRKISQSRYQFGKADSYYDSKLSELETSLAAYHQETEDGNYIEAKQLVDGIKEELDFLAEQIEAFPDIYKKAKHDLPSQFENIISGMKDMETDGYYIDHLDFKVELRTYQERVTDIMEALEQGNLEDASVSLHEIEERLSEMYEALEEEALAKSYIEKHVSSYQDAVTALNTSVEATKTEVEKLKKAYYVEDNELDIFLSVGKKAEELKKQLNFVTDKLEENNTAHTELKELIETGLTQIEELEAKHKIFKENIQTLRKDELLAKDKLAEMHDEITALSRRLKKSNIPGVPTFIWTSLEETQDKNVKVMKALEQQPLDTAAVHRALSEAESAIEQTTEKIDMMLDQAVLTEQVIQYANRYRSRNPILAGKLAEAERLFRSYEYELSLEIAAKAIEEIEPGALKRIEETRVAIK